MTGERLATDVAPTEPPADDDSPLPALTKSAVNRIVPWVFASLGSEQRSRRPADVVAVIASTVTLVVLGVVHDPGSALSVDLPSWWSAFFAATFAVAGVYAVTIIVVAVLSGDRPKLARDLLVAVASAFAIAMLVSWWSDGSLGRVLTTPWSRGESFPVMRVALLTTVVVTASPHLIRPIRRAGWVLVVGSAAAAVLLELGGVDGVVGAFALGVGVAAITHLIFGSPVGAPPPSRVAEALHQLGIEAVIVDPDPRRRGVAEFAVVTATGERLRVKVYGRDASDTQLAVTAWRTLWYRDRRGTLSLTRRQQAEHEALLAILARRADVPVPEILSAGASARGDALVITSWPGEPFDPPDDGDESSETRIEARPDPLAIADTLWDAIDRMEAIRIAHGAIDFDHLRLCDGQVLLANWGDARLGADDDHLVADAAAVLAMTAVLVGPDEAIALLTRRRDPQRVQRILTAVQPAALTASLRRRVKAADVDLDELRKTIATSLDIKPPELTPLRRVTWGGILAVAAVALGAWILVSSLAEIGWDTLVEAISEASWELLVAALVVGQTPRVAQALSVVGASPAALPLGPTSLMQFAVTFVNLVVPSTAARVAMVMRYQQRFGVAPKDALTASAIDSFGGFLVQIFILIVTIGFGWATIDIDWDSLNDSALGTLLIIVIVVGAMLIVATFVVRPLRNFVLSLVRSAFDGVRRLRSPRRAAGVFGGNLLAEVLFATTLGIVCVAYGEHVGLADLLAINVIVALFAGLMPVPGGIGVTEAALTAGLVAVGVDEVDALAIAISYRMVTFYLPPIWGAVALRWLRRREYL
jgi:uncharacterized membrane protein YbhN (UPF0104 family)